MLDKFKAYLKEIANPRPELYLVEDPDAQQEEIDPEAIAAPTPMIDTPISKKTITNLINKQQDTMTQPNSYQNDPMMQQALAKSRAGRVMDQKKQGRIIY